MYRNRYCLYRHFNAANELLYVGQSLSVLARTCAHIRDAAWADEIRTITLEFFPTSNDLDHAEIVAIKTESPKYNRKHAGHSPIPEKRGFKVIGFYKGEPVTTPVEYYDQLLRWFESMVEISPLFTSISSASCR